MSKLAIAIISSLLAGFAFAAIVLNSPDVVEPGVVESEASGFDSNADIDDRISALESAVSIERDARQLLEEEILALYDEIYALENERQPEAIGQVGSVLAEVAVDPREMRAMARANRRNEGEQRRDVLIDAGFSASRADWIVQRESELRMEAMQERYDAMRSGEPMNRAYDYANAELGLRQEMGEGQYESYLAASGRSTEVGIRSIFESSPAQTAGLKSGDQITHYDGARIFNTSDLTRQTMEGNAGENVVVNITRDGIPMQLVLPRGPLGVTTNGRR
jgi:hypothetical protein